VSAALRAGYRHIDTAAAYRKERETGRAVADSDVPRDQLYVVTKLANPDQGYDSTLAAFPYVSCQHGPARARLSRPVLDPLAAARASKFVDTFKAFAHLRDRGRIRSIGVSNFEPEHLTVRIDATGIVPAVNQIELHPRLPQRELREVHAQRGIVTEAWAPLAKGSLLTHPKVTAVAESPGRTPALVLIRWHIQLVISSFPSR
jgi:2,5-diketo-D-gluconate reductase A